MREQYPELQKVVGDLPSLPFDPRRQPASGDDHSSLRELLADALLNPTDFPPLDASVIEGDRLALAVDPRIPKLAEILVGIVEFFQGCKLAGIDIVLWDESSESLVKNIQERVIDQARVHVHRGDQREELRYLEADIDAEPVYVPRVLADADMVIPLTLDRHHGDPTLLFPMLVDTATIARFQDSGRKLTDEQCRIGWSMGIMVQVVIKPDRYGNVGQIEVSTVGRDPMPASDVLASSLSETGSLNSADESQADLTIVTLSGDAPQQSWPSVARAVEQAACRTRAGGTIVVWTSLRPSDQDLNDQGSNDQNDHSFCTDQVDDPGEAGFPAAKPISSALHAVGNWCRDHTIYLCSGFDDETVEGFGMAAIHDENDLRRLVETSEQSLVLWAADQLARP